MGKVIRIDGQRFGRWTALRRSGKRIGGRRRHWVCRCDCGNERAVLGSCLKRGSSRSCGCLKNEETAARSTTHGAWRTPEYEAWRGMLNRCRSRGRSYRYYGARGIAVCKRWSSFETFLADMGPRPSPKHSLDRINNSGNYEPGNCRWATMSEQVRNSRRARMLTHAGKTMVMVEWANAFGIDRSTLCQRISRHGIERALAMGPKRLAPIDSARQVRS